ncbi:CDP-diacylglycerol--serine O-phosphatidyltransferase [Paenibacillus thailandensis]|uniref:CDP-diacylglycerol--serine O-phosphatidyltransferase n=1 Tax=Paenibacillus thailandensis TaxID=393250 RepID=A0ABW5R241_9BACL
MITKSIPSLLTAGNLFLGVIAIILVFNDKPENAAMMVIIAMLLDGVDGRVARALDAQSEFGKELDSLADVISFGVAPAFIMYVTSFQQLNPTLAWTITALFPLCGALRLARFNVISSSAGYFIGLPIPAAGGVLATLALFHEDIAVSVLVASMLVLALLMVSTIKYPNFKKVGVSKKALWVVPVVIAVTVLLGLLFPDDLSKIIFVPLLLYAIYGLKKNVDRRGAKRRRRRHADPELEDEQKQSEHTA